MHARSVKDAKAVEQSRKDYIRSVAGPSTADQLQKLASLRDLFAGTLLPG